jgi:fatty acid desaturase
MDFKSWQDVLIWVIIGLTFLFGAPIIQVIKIGLEKLFKKPIKDKLAVFVALVVAAALALLQMWLSGLLTSWPISLDTFPEFLSAVFGVATVYFKLFMSGK